MRRKIIPAICIIVGVSLVLYKWKYIDVHSAYGQSIQTSELATDVRNSKEALHKRQSKSDVLINGYMRSGSSLIGRLLGHRNDTFYWYEPLQKHSLRWKYLRGDNQLCETLKPTCTHDTGLLNRSLRMISGIYNCSFYSDHWESIADGMHPKESFGGPSWQTYLDCRKQNNYSQEHCLKEMTPSCRSHTHRVTKVLRLSIDNAAKLLNNNPRLKIVHLFRDPRGIINSHVHTSWFPVSLVKKTTDLIQNDVMPLCERMLYDIEKGEQLLQQFPGRIRFIQYEDLDQQTMIAKVLKLYTFLGMSYNDGYQQSFLERLTEKHVYLPSDGNHPFLYRRELSWDVVQLIDKQCSDVYNALGYVKFQSAEELKNMSIPAIKRPLPFTIL